MILDNLLLFSNAQSLAVAAGTTDSSNIIDWGNLGLPSSSASILGVGQFRDMGIGDHPALKLLVQVGTTFAGGTSLQARLRGAIDDGTGNPAAFSTWWVSPVYALATLNAGSRLFDMDFPRPPDGIAIPRYVKMDYVTLGTFTAGTITAGIVLDRMDQPYQGTDNAVMGGYPAGITVAN